MRGWSSYQLLLANIVYKQISELCKCNAQRQSIKWDFTQQIWSIKYSGPERSYPLHFFFKKHQQMKNASKAHKKQQLGKHSGSGFWKTITWQANSKWLMSNVHTVLYESHDSLSYHHISWLKHTLTCSFFSVTTPMNPLLLLSV